MRRGWRAAAALALATASGVGASAFGATTPNLLAVLAGPIASARAHGVPVLLPARIAAHAPHLYGGGGATAAGYDIRLAAAPGCRDAACFVAEFTAAASRLVRGTPVALAHGLRGGYLRSRCGASCDPATIAWREYGHGYAIAYMGSRAQMVALADAAIDGGPR